MANSLQQIVAVTALNIRSVPSRLGSSLVIVIGIAGVVGVMVALLSMARGFEATLASTGRPDRAIVLRGGSNDELGSVVFRDKATVIKQTPGIKKGADGQPLVVAEKYVLTSVARIGSTEPNNIVVRGTEARALLVRPEVKLIEGRMFNPGMYEVIVGRAAA